MEEYMVGNVFVYSSDGELTVFNDKFSVNFENVLNQPLADVHVSALNEYIEEFYQIYATHVIEESNYSDEFKNWYKFTFIPQAFAYFSSNVTRNNLL